MKLELYDNYIKNKLEEYEEGSFTYDDIPDLIADIVKLVKIAKAAKAITDDTIPAVKAYEDLSITLKELED